MVDESAVRVVTNYLRALESGGLPVSFAVVFGSYATGRADRWSDIDLVVVSPRYDEPYGWEDVFRLWRVAGQTDSRIEPIECGERQWEEDDETPIIEIARREGQRIRLNR